MPNNFIRYAVLLNAFESIFLMFSPLKDSNVMSPNRLSSKVKGPPN